MSQNDYSIINADGASVRQDVNDALQADQTKNAGTNAPGTTYPNQWWVDNTNNLLKIRNKANSGWVTVAEWDGANWVPYRNGTALGTAATSAASDFVPSASDALTSGYGVDGVSLSDSATVSIDLTQANAFDLSITQNFTLSNPTEVSNSTKGTWIVDVHADSNGPYTITLDTAYKLQDGTLSVEASATIRLWIVQRAAGSYDVIAEALS